MTKYEELVASLVPMYDAWYRYQDEAFDFVRKFCDALQSHLEAPDGTIWTFDFDDYTATDDMRRQPPARACRCDDTAMFRVGVAIRISQPNGWFDLGSLLDFRGIDGDFTGKFGQVAFQNIAIAELPNLCERIFQEIKTTNETGLNRTLRGSTQRVGFHAQ